MYPSSPFLSLFGEKTNSLLLIKWNDFGQAIFIVGMYLESNLTLKTLNLHVNHQSYHFFKNVNKKIDEKFKGL